MKLARHGPCQSNNIILCLLLGIEAISLINSIKEEVIYITPTEPPNPECPHQNASCQTLQYYLANSGDYLGYLIGTRLNRKVTLLFLNGNHTLPFCLCNRYSDPSMTILHMIGLNGNVVIHNLDLILFASQLTIDNIGFHTGALHMILSKCVFLYSVRLVEYTLYVNVISGDLVELQSYNSQLLVEDNSNVTFANCTFRDFSGSSYPALGHQLTQTAVTVHQSHVTFTGTSLFYNNQHSALVSYSSEITLVGSVSFLSNTGIRGGAVALFSSIINLAAGANIVFINNSAQETGGAIHIEPDLTRMLKLECFYRVNNCNVAINILFENNSAENGGDNVYGTSLNYCQELADHDCINTTTLGTRKSPVSSDPLFVCICDNEGQPQCTNISFINMSMNVHPGEIFALSAITVGLDYGRTVGTVYADFLISPDESNSSVSASESIPVLKQNYQYSQWINNIVCTELTYSILTEHIWHNFIMYLTVQYTKNPRNLAKENDWKYCNYRKYLSDSFCRYSPIYINVTILPCPSGFILLRNPFRCDCYLELINNGVQCVIKNGTGYFIWYNSLWISVNTGGRIVYTENCPLNHCMITNKVINLIETPYAQCAFNRAGRLCGSCRKGYSLAIGSSSCIHCPNNNNLALLTFFIAAGFLLVFFINILNLTVTQGMINGLIFYANIVWTSQSILFPLHEVNNAAIAFLRIFLAWINLDFGIETCFINGFNALGKMWLQFLFPIYIWVIAGLMIITAKYSKMLTKIYGNRSVPVLATLFLLSYTKLLRTVVTIFLFTHLSEIPKGSTLIVWSVDGELDYFGTAHGSLLVAALIVVIFLWLPYTLSLLFLQQLQKVSNSYWLLKWVSKLSPFYDAHFAPFKTNHRYWFGLLLLIRGILLVLFASTVTIHQSVYLLIVLVFGIALLLYVAIMHPFKSIAVLIIQSSSLANLVLLSGLLLYAQTRTSNMQILQTTAAGISTGVIFVQFCGITLHNAIKVCHSRCSDIRRNYNDNQEMNEVNNDFLVDYCDSREIMDSLSTHQH